MLANKIVEAVRSVIGNGPHALHEPLFIGNEQKYVARAVASGWVAQGETIECFEDMLCAFTGARYAVATCNATCALHIALLCKGVGDGDRVSVSPLTFIATANAIRHAGAKPVFRDAGIFLPHDGMIQVDLLGHLVPRMHDGYSFGLLNDSAQALGSFPFNGTSIFSFNGNKIITTGGGGAIVTDDNVLAHRARHLITQARIPHAWQILHDDIGFNYRMPNINAALGCAQMEQLPNILKAKRALAQKYIEAFESIGVRPWKEPEGTKSNYWLNAIILDDPADQEPTLQALHDAGYMARMLPTPLHMLEPYKNCPRNDLSASEGLWRRVICLPSSPKLGVKYD